MQAKSGDTASGDAMVIMMADKEIFGTGAGFRASTKYIHAYSFLPGWERRLKTASPPTRSLHSGAGRIVRLRMRPSSLAERDLVRPTVSLAALMTGSRPTVRGTCPLRLEDYVREIVAGGFPALRQLAGSVRKVASVRNTPANYRNNVALTHTALDKMYF